jgi:hypothetical protein
MTKTPVAIATFGTAVTVVAACKSLPESQTPAHWTTTCPASYEKAFGHVQCSTDEEWMHEWRSAKRLPRQFECEFPEGRCVCMPEANRR